MNLHTRLFAIGLFASLVAGAGCVPEQSDADDEDDRLVVETGDAGADATPSVRDAGPNEADANPAADSTTDDTGRTAGDAASEDTSTADAASKDTSTTDASPCGPDQIECGSECVDPTSSDRHCGECDNSCSSPTSCRSGKCACPDGQTLCGDQCVDTSNNDRHCGECNAVCNVGQSCSGGQCSCPQGKSLCDGSCIDTTSDPANCGGCGNTCATGEICKQSKCETDPKVATVISETNNTRSTTTDCGTEGTKSAAPALTGSTELHRAAQAHADDMAMNDFVGHTGSDGSDFVTRINRTNFSGYPVAENVAGGQTSATQVVQGWVDSDGHCKNIMLQRATHIGVGVAYNMNSTYGWYWVQVFGKK
jgi:uncharacterized protein YkwD